MKKIERGVKKSVRFLTYVCAFILTATVSTFFSSNKRSDHSTSAPESPWSGISISHADTPHDSGGDQYDSAGDGDGGADADGCFGADVQILMSDGSAKSIQAVTLGDLTQGGFVDAAFKFLVPKRTTHSYLGDVVTGTHPVFSTEHNDWRHVSDCRLSLQRDHKGQTVVYTFDASQRKIYTTNATYTDFNEIEVYEPLAQKYYRDILKYLNPHIEAGIYEESRMRSHAHGFVAGTLVEMADGSEKDVEEVCIGDMTRGGKVTGEMQYSIKSEDEVYISNGALVHGQTLVKVDGRWEYLQQTHAQRVACNVDRVHTLVCTSGLLYVNGLVYRDGLRIPANSALERAYRNSLLTQHNTARYRTKSGITVQNIMNV